MTPNIAATIGNLLVHDAVDALLPKKSNEKPEKNNIRFDEFTEFGFLFEQFEDEKYPCWSFMFEVQHPSVFDDGISELGALYNDCHGIPMIKCGTEWEKLPAILDSTDELRNIYFKVAMND